jgi:osmoprotectant transport system substrate-binding protein
LLVAAGLGFALAAAAAATTTGPSTGTSSTATSTNPAAALPGYGRPTILLGDKNTPEQFILGALYSAALQAQGYDVELSRNIGPPAVAQQALAQGSLDVYPEYLNVWDGQIADTGAAPRTLPAAYHDGQRYAHAHKLELLPPTPFSDTAGVVVATPYASGNHLRQIADLVPVENYLTFGGPLPFLQGSADGLPTLEQTYGIKPATVQQLDVGASYTALTNGQVEAAYASTTDPQLGNPDFRLLADPKHVFGIGNVVPVVSQQTLLAEGPALARTLDQVDALLTTRAMRGLNAEVEVQHHSAAEVATTFLQGNGILPPPPWSTRGVQPPPTSTSTSTSTSTYEATTSSATRTSETATGGNETAG